ncbi:hypothetical protein DIURU_000490 [Diutina rugosa]|uniref:Uncharacterized protein n=1 Tax=Diutina rugosa TaxID=5481 RepID=A0A642UXW3_DIURU|nr:uncharacterized protein DIURU_000490 [Diutina rugosa]KAA8907803.1 hypothetical protein DIURU_000490 [Diutina rugosa]
MSSEYPETEPTVEASTQASTQSQKIMTKQFKLISVNLKEAALDSPSFRASVNHLDIQVDNVEKWLRALVSSCRKLPSYLKELQSFFNSFLEHLVPTFLQDGLIDQEYTVQSLRTSLEGLRRLWGLALSMLQVNLTSIESLNSIMQKSIAHYKEVRQRFEVNQHKYERYLALYASTSKTKDASMIVEDAQELFKVRKAYIHASLDLVIEINQLSSQLDSYLVKMSTNLWKTKRSLFSDTVMPGYRESWDKIHRIQAWSSMYSESLGKFKRDMYISRQQVEDSAIAQCTPSQNPEDYRTSTINRRMLANSNETAFEKHGYLFMKTWYDNLSKPVWVRRWCFFKGGVFGMLVLSPQGTYVQETDKIGILLCNAKYYPNEDRRFCFELKTSGMSIILQAESLSDLKSWLKVFDNERHRIAQNPLNDQHLLDVASGRFPPLVSEFASTQPSAVDRQLTSLRCVDGRGNVITSNNLSSHISQNEELFVKHIYYQIPTIRPPFMTGTTKTSIIAYLTTPATPLPSALTANIWGSVNWGVYYLHENSGTHRSTALSPYSTNDITVTSSSEEPIENGKLPGNTSTEEEGGNGKSVQRGSYPEYYPASLVPEDIQLRALFETAVEPNEYCLLSFRCIWSPNSRQDLSGRCFITKDHVYFYMLASGFVALFKDKVNRLVSVDHVAQKNFDYLKIYTIDGSVKIKLFLDDGRAIQKKIISLISNATSNKSKGIEKLLDEMKEIDKNANDDLQDSYKLHLIAQLAKSVTHQERVYSLLHSKGSNLLAEAGAPTSSVVEKPGLKSHVFRTNFRDDYTYSSVDIYNLSPKALFHALLGDHSIVLRETSTFSKVDCFPVQPWRVGVPPYRQNNSTDANSTDMWRCFNVETRYNHKCQAVQVEQVIDNMYDDEYYTFTHSMSYFEFFLGSRFSLDYKFVIVGVAGKRSQVYVYSRRNFTSRSIFSWGIDKLCHTISLTHASEIHKALHKVVKEVGHHGMVAKAIYFYGKLSITDLPYKQEPIPTITYRFLDVNRVLLERVCLIILGVIVLLVRGVIRFAKATISSVTMNKLLITLCAVSMIFNLILSSRMSINYWAVRKASDTADKFVHSKPINIQRSIHMNDVYELLDVNLDNANSSSVAAFKNASFILNYDHSSSWLQTYGDEQTCNTAKRLGGSMSEINVRRNELLTELKILNSMEKELVVAEFRNWLTSELRKCSVVKRISWEDVHDTERNSNLDEIAEGVENIEKYCSDVAKQIKRFNY